MWPGSGRDLKEWIQDHADRRAEDHERRLHRIEHQSIWNELARVGFLTLALLVDVLVVGEILRIYPDPWRWLLFAVVLALVLYIQARIYRIWWPPGWDEPGE